MLIIGALLGGVVGAIAGAGGSSTTTELNLDPAGALEKQAGSLTREQLAQLQELIGSGAGGQDVSTALSSSRQFSETLRTAAATGFGSRQLQRQAGAQAQAFLAPQREQLSQTFEDETTRTAQLAAQLGRSIDDPILQAKLSTARFREEALLSSQQAGLQLQFGQQQLGLLGQATGVDQSLSAQAFQNRFGVLQAGQGVLGQQQQFRLGSAGQTVSSGGGLAGAISGGLGGIGSAFSLQAASARTGILQNFQKQQEQQIQQQNIGNQFSSQGFRLS